MRTRLLVAAGLAAALEVAAIPTVAVVQIEWVEIGSPGNACDTQAQGCFGGVGNPYRIGRTEVTNAQYAEFLNAVADSDPNGLYSTGQALSVGGITQSGSEGSFSYATVAGRESKPVTFVSWYAAVRFVNWLANGQPTGAQGAGTTETGTYTLAGFNSISGGRASGATIFLPNEDEWYKAAYFNPALGFYYDYPARTNTPTVCATPTATANRANCDSTVNDKTDVGSYTGSASPFGTFDQGGNVAEWNETEIFFFGSNRGSRGGNWDYYAGDLAASGRVSDDPTGVYATLGFRVASVPECSDGIDNDGDGRSDFDPVTFASPGDENTYPAGQGDPACTSPIATRENSKCQDGLHNDGDGKMDYDGGRSTYGAAQTAADPQCVGQPWKNKEKSPACGLGFELALPLAALMAIRSWRRA